MAIYLISLFFNSLISLMGDLELRVLFNFNCLSIFMIYLNLDLILNVEDSAHPMSTDWFSQI